MSNKTILLVDDHPDDIELKERAFEEAHNANTFVVPEEDQEALENIFVKEKYTHRCVNQTLTLILLDLTLLEIDGLEFLKKIHAAEIIIRLPVVILISSKQEQDVAAGYDLGVNGDIRKPVDFFKFVEAIKYLGLNWLIINEQMSST